MRRLGRAAISGLKNGISVSGKSRLASTNSERYGSPREQKLTDERQCFLCVSESPHHASIATGTQADGWCQPVQ